MNGRCQGFFCGAEVGPLMDRRGTAPAHRDPRGGTADDRRDLTTLTTGRRHHRRGPAGLTAAARLAGRTGAGVLVLDRESTPGGIPRHSDHPGYGIRDMRTLYERARPTPARLAAQAAAAGAAIRDGRHGDALGRRPRAWRPPPRGPLRVEARAVVLATGARERPRPARLIPGTGPRGSTPPASCSTSSICSTEGRQARRHRRRGAGQLVGGADPARGRLPSRR